jgi:hypothetical protein
MGDLFSVDSRIWRTLLPLFFRPGTLTIAYLAGRRDQYLPPFRTYLILSLLFFGVASLVGEGWEVTVTDDPLTDIETALAPTESNFDCRDIQLGAVGFWNPAALQDGIYRACETVQADDGEALLKAVSDNLPMMMFFFIPLVAFLMKILYLFANRKYIEHLLFLFHYHAFFFMILADMVIISALGRAFPVLATPAKIILFVGWMYVPIYLYLALRRVYGQGRGLTGVKFGLLLSGYAGTMLLSIGATMTYTALTL